MAGHTAYIAGQWDAGTGTEHAVLEAATGEVIDSVRLGEAADVDRAVAAAKLAREAWAGTPQTERAAILGAMAGYFKKHAAETAALVSRENGMPITLSTAVSGYAPAVIFGYYAKLVGSFEWESVRPAMFGGSTLVTRNPVGVVAAIVPWNYPQSLAAMKVAPALAAGCTVVLKPAPETALDAAVFAAAAESAGLPPGVLNIVPADRAAGAYLVEHPDVDKVAFTGSTAAGRAIGEVCGRLLRPVTLELGGKSAAILTEDADLDVFAGKVLDVCLPHSGQTCHASTRVLAPRSRYTEVVGLLADTVAAYRVGDPLDPATQIGALASPAQLDRVLGHIDSGKASGARLVHGGSRIGDTGNFVAPTVFADVPRDAAIAREEIFGPVLCVLPYDGIDDAVAIANDSAYGLAGTVWSSGTEQGIAIARRLQTGTVGVNRYDVDVAAPFGGVKSSGLGREMGPEGLSVYLQPKSIYLGE